MTRQEYLYEDRDDPGERDVDPIAGVEQVGAQPGGRGVEHLGEEGTDGRLILER